jgi:hypothetical protein
MARKPATNPRKSASQDRSRLTIEALLEAMARVLMKEGYDRASANKIAATAGRQHRPVCGRELFFRNPKGLYLPAVVFCDARGLEIDMMRLL